MKYIKKAMFFAAMTTVCLYAVWSLCSCKAKDAVDEIAPVPSSLSPSEDNNETEKVQDRKFIEDLPEIDFGDRAFTFWSYGDGTELDWTAFDAVSETYTGEPINDAVMDRNTRLEERLKIRIEVQFGKTSESVDRSVKSGDNAFDAVWLNLWHAGMCAQKGSLLDLHELKYINLEKGYWDNCVTRDLSVGGKIYFATGDISIYDDRGTWVLMFNKAMVRDNQIENPYGIVQRGEWTVEKFREMLRNTSKDLNGDGVWDENDQYGLSTTNDTIIGLFYSCDERFIGKNSGNMIAYNMDGGDKMQKILELTVDIMKNDHTTISSSDINVANSWAVTRRIFAEDRALFYAEVLWSVEALRAMETDFGIIPMPKYNVQQERYVTFVAGSASLLSVPVTCDDREFTGVVLEAMAAESNRTLKPAYYDITLKDKLSRDPESTEMLDLILSNRIYDLGYIYDFGGVLTTYVGLAAKGSTELTSALERIGPKVTKELDAFNGIFN